MITIKHDIKRYGRALKGHILDCKFSGEGSKRYDGIRYYSKDNNKYIASFREPELRDNILCVWGYHTEADLKEIAYTYGSEQAAQDMLDFINTFTEKEEMKKYTLEQLKTEKIAIHTKTQEIFDTLIKKLEERKICWANGQQANKLNLYAIHQERTSIDLFSCQGKIVCAIIVLNRSLGYTIITPDQIDWGEAKKADVGQVTINGGIMPPTDWKITTTLIYPPKQDNAPLVFSKAQKDWNAFKSFVKDVETHGRGLTSSQLKAFMAKVRKDMGEVKK